MSGDSPFDPRARTVWLTLFLGSAAFLVWMAVAGRYAVVWKTVIVPVLLLAALATGRIREFLVDWGIFLGATMLFDSLRGLVYTGINLLDLPVYMGYAIRWERALLGGSTLPEILQGAWLSAEEPSTLTGIFVVFHASHFLFFLLFGLLVWLTRRDDFRRFSQAMILVMFGGLALYLAVPTVPPWMASLQFESLGRVEQLTRDVYNMTLPAAQKAFATNPVAAMPSLHAAFPMLAAFVALHHYRLRGLLALAYSLGISLSIGYLGEHYVVDILAGWGLAGLAYWWSYRRRPGPEGARGWIPGNRERLAAAAVLLLVGHSIGLWSRAYHWSYRPSPSFIERELGDRPIASFHRARQAFDRADFPEAQAQMSEAIGALEHPSNRARARMVLGLSALENGDLATGVENLEEVPLPLLGARAGAYLVGAQLRLGRTETGLETLDRLTEWFGEDPDFAVARIHLEVRAGRLDDQSAVEKLRALGAIPSPEAAPDGP